jgi:predicted amino acid dehydrogenase
MLLVGRVPGALEGLEAELGGSRVARWEEAAPRSDVVVLVASATRGAVPLAGVPEDAFILDAGHPPNGTGGRRRYAIAGRVSHDEWPVCDLPAVLDTRYEPGEAHACLAEGEVLALEGRWECFSGRRGRIVPERAAEILALAQRHGVRPAPLLFRASACASP